MAARRSGPPQWSVHRDVQLTRHEKHQPGQLVGTELDAAQAERPLDRADIVAPQIRPAQVAVAQFHLGKAAIPDGHARQAAVGQRGVAELAPGFATLNVGGAAANAAAPPTWDGQLAM